MCRKASIVVLCAVVIAVWMAYGPMNVVQVATTRDQRAFFRGLAAVHCEGAGHKCSGVLISQQFVMTTLACLNGAGNLLAVDILNPEEISYLNESNGNFHQLARKDEAPRLQETSTGTTDAVLMKLPLSVATPLPSFENGNGDVGCLESIQSGEEVDDGQKNGSDIVPGDIVFIPDAWHPREYRKMRAGGLEECGGRRADGAKLACAIWEGAEMSASFVGGPVYKKRSAKGRSVGGGPGGPSAYVIAGIIKHVGEASEAKQKITIINISSELERFQRSIDRQNLWVNVPPERLPAFTLILAPDGTSSPSCKGMLIKGRFVLTAAHCVDQLGTNPLVVVGATSIDGPHFGHGQQKLRVESAHPHPYWNGRIQDGFDIALLKLPRHLDVASPTLADVKRWGVTNYTDPNAVVYGFRLGSVLEGVLFDVVVDKACPDMGKLASHMFCAHKYGAKLHNGCSGGPILQIDGDINDGDDDPRNDLLVGVVSCTNYAKENSGIGCVEVSDVIGWIRDVTERRDFISSWKRHLQLPGGLTAIISFTGLPFIILNPTRPLQGVWRFCFCCAIAIAAISSISDLMRIIAKHLQNAGPPGLLCIYSTVLGWALHRIALDLWDTPRRAALWQILANFAEMLRGFWRRVVATGDT